MNDPILPLRETRLWFTLLGRGFVGLLVGMLLLTNPWASLGTIAMLFVAYVVADGALSLYAGRRMKRLNAGSRPFMLLGLVDVAAAVLAIALPSALPLRLIGGVRAVVGGACDVRWPRGKNRSELLTLAGVAAIGFGVLLLGWPGPGTTALPWLLGLEAMVSGSLLVGGALSEIRRVGETIAPQEA